MKPILCVDFDGVIHSYTSGWQGASVVSDPVVPGFFDWLEETTKLFQVVIYSSRSKDPFGIIAMQDWLDEQYDKTGRISPMPSVEFAHEKPAAFLTLDDRAICFNGTWPDPAEMRSFKPWNKKEPL